MIAPRRRDVLRAAAGAVTFAGLGGPGEAARSGWRRYEIVTRVALPRLKAAVRVFSPIPTAGEELQILDARFDGNADYLDIFGDSGTVVAEWLPGALSPELEVVVVVSTASADTLSSLGRPWARTAVGRCEEGANGFRASVSVEPVVA